MMHYVWVKNSLQILDGYWAVWIILNGEMRTTKIYWRQSGFQSETDSHSEQVPWELPCTQQIEQFVIKTLTFCLG